MQDTELYRQILGLKPPWFVSKVELKMKDERVDVWTEHDEKVRWTCPECDRQLPLS